MANNIEYRNRYYLDFIIQMLYDEVTNMVDYFGYAGRELSTYLQN